MNLAFWPRFEEGGYQAVLYIPAAEDLYLIPTRYGKAIVGTIRVEQAVEHMTAEINVELKRIRRE